MTVATPLLPVVPDRLTVEPFAFVTDTATATPDAATPPLVTVVAIDTTCMLV